MSVSQLNEILETIADLQMTIVSLDTPPSPVAWAGGYFDAMVSLHDVPFFANQLTGGPVTPAAAGMLQGVRDVVKMYLALQGYEQGYSFDRNEEYVVAWRDPVIRMFGEHLRLGGSLAYLMQAYISEWDIEIAEIGSTEFWCLRFNLTIDERFPVAVGE